MNRHSFPLLCRTCAAVLFLTLAGGCNAFTTKVPQPSFYSLERAQAVAPAESHETAPTLIVNPPHAAAGYDSPRIIYTRTPHQLEYFAHSDWVDTPARMLAPLLVTALQNSGSFRAVILTPSGAAGDLRLDTEVLRLQQDFSRTPSQVQVTLRAYIVDNSTRRVLASGEFDETAAAASDDPEGGVIAANRAVQAALEKLAAFCSDAAQNWEPAASAEEDEDEDMEDSEETMEDDE